MREENANEVGRMALGRLEAALRDLEGLLRVQFDLGNAEIQVHFSEGSPADYTLVLRAPFSYNLGSLND